MPLRAIVRLHPHLARRRRLAPRDVLVADVDHARAALLVDVSEARRARRTAFLHRTELTL
jgi:hypothetical protein